MQGSVPQRPVRIVWFTIAQVRSGLHGIQRRPALRVFDFVRRRVRLPPVEGGTIRHPDRGGLDQASHVMPVVAFR